MLQDRDRSRRSSRSSSRHRPSSSRNSNKKRRNSGDIIELSSSEEDVKIIDGKEVDDDRGATFKLFFSFLAQKTLHQLMSIKIRISCHKKQLKYSNRLATL
jgi:hypothetical protein